MQTASNGIKSDEPGSHAACPAPSRTRLGLVGVLVVLTGLAAVRLLTVVWMSSLARVRAPGPASSDEVVVLVAASVAAGLAAWLVLGIVLELAARLPGRCGRVAQGWSQRVTPALARRAAGVVLGIGVGVVGGPAQAVAVGPSSAVTVTAAPLGDGRAPDPGFRAAPSPADGRTEPGRSAAPATSTATAAAPVTTPAPTPGFTPAAPRVRPQADPGLLGARVAPRMDAEVVVHRGDSLWSIAAGHLGPDASDAEVDVAWRQWFALNREVVGPDPDLLLPGQVLRVPHPDSTAGAVR